MVRSSSISGLGEVRDWRDFVFEHSRESVARAGARREATGGSLDNGIPLQEQSCESGATEGEAIDWRSRWSASCSNYRATTNLNDLGLGQTMARFSTRRLRLYDSNAVFNSEEFSN
ncbi:hypothetical protein GOBAR_AA15222 [Gossypium barbadense]|uniref:Uncharacterized protein n=1 Tax=Gossypium barbadense TaxID=3634 RepID=A0A2P5XQ17_GOSBA|nr:hypothetical protein GOBAR_AA15222 [Gossypium barbadense]